MLAKQARAGDVQQIVVALTNSQHEELPACLAGCSK
jgi:hypothetical protein